MEPMPKRPTIPRTVLGVAMQARRGTATVTSAAAEIGLSIPGYYRIEAGARRPNTASTIKIAQWLGWTMEEVYQAASAPVVKPAP